LTGKLVDLIIVVFIPVLILSCLNSETLLYLKQNVFDLL